MNINLCDDLREILKRLGTLLPNQQLSPIGGSCGLVLQGVDIGRSPRDIDMYYDMNYGAELYSALKPYEIDAPQLGETERYCSVLSHYDMNRYILELVGDFRVFVGESVYDVKIEEVLLSDLVLVDLDGVSLYVMPLSHELVFNVLRSRLDRVAAIARVMRNKENKHKDCLERILSHNRISKQHIQELQLHLGWELRTTFNGKE